MTTPAGGAAGRIARPFVRAVIAVAGAVLIGWWTGWEQVTTVLPGLASMKPNTALCLLLIGIALSGPTPGPRAPRRAAPWITLGLTGLTLAEMVSGRGLRIDRLVPGTGLPSDASARMAEGTAVALLLLSMAVLFAWHGSRRAAQFLAVLALLGGYVAVIGYLNGASELYAVAGFSSMALHTALAIVVLALALLMGLRSLTLDLLINDRGGAGRMARGLLPFLVAGPPLLGWLRLRAESYGWFDTEFGVGLLVTAFTVTSVAILMRTGGQMLLAQLARDASTRQVLELNRTLEASVTARTAELSTARAHLAAAFASSPLGTALTRLDGTIEEVNRVLPQMLATSAESLTGRQVEELFEDGREVEDHRLRTELVERGSGSYQLERRMNRADERLCVRSTVTAIEDETGLRGLLLQLEDVTARKLAEDRAEHLSLHDALTDLPNRALLLDRLRQSLVRSRRTGRGVGVLFIDLDRFKVVNDSLGHQAGDSVLTEVARRLHEHARSIDTVARIGGDEFVVLCPDVDSDGDVLHVAQTVREAVTRPMMIDGTAVHIDASVGVAFGQGHDDADLMLRQANQAMYRAKDRGGARFEVFDDALRASIERRVDAELAMRGATDRGEIEAWFQPIVELSTGGVAASETLARWIRPERGLTLPCDFIGIAEETGLIKEIGAHMLLSACLAATRWESDAAVSVNVSPRQFLRADFAAVVGRALQESGLAPERLWLELTESAVVDAIDSAARSFQELREQGIRIAIDDFGTGFSSFAHLRRFQVDLVKIDMTFIDELEHSAHDRAIVEGILRMAEALSLGVVAEGIVTTGQRDLLRGMGCRYGQGYLFGRPAPFLPASREPSLPRPRQAGRGGLDQVGPSHQT